jgi:type IV pilus assembly protein PilV
MSIKPRKLNKVVNLSARLQRGFTLIEVLVSIVVLAVGLLGVAGLQMFSLKNTHSAYMRSQATLLAYDIIDSIRANPAAMASYAVAMGAFPGGTYATCVGTSANCTTSQMAIFDLHQWKCTLGLWSGGAHCNSGGLENITGLLPNGDASVVVSGDDVTVTVRWIDKDEREEADTASDKLVDLAITTRIQ